MGLIGTSWGFPWGISWDRRTTGPVEENMSGESGAGTGLAQNPRMDWTTINLGPEIYGEGKTTQP